jgi:hypothetical protein
MNLALLLLCSAIFELQTYHKGFGSQSSDSKFDRCWANRYL